MQHRSFVLSCRRGKGAPAFPLCLPSATTLDVIGLGGRLRESSHSNLTDGGLNQWGFWLGGRLREVVAQGGSTLAVIYKLYRGN